MIKAEVYEDAAKRPINVSPSPGSGQMIWIGLDGFPRMLVDVDVAKRIQSTLHRFIDDATKQQNDEG